MQLKVYLLSSWKIAHGMKASSVLMSNSRPQNLANVLALLGRTYDLQYITFKSPSEHTVRALRALGTLHLSHHHKNLLVINWHYTMLGGLPGYPQEPQITSASRFKDNAFSGLS